jgi:ATP-dependent RNA helicase RhlE
MKLISEGDWQQVLIFTRTKHGANRLSEKLNKSDISAAAIHGNKSQGARTKALDGFKKGTVRILVATDIAARGLDIPLLPHVINFELPNVPEDYVHRIGRTGRAGASGEAISLVSQDEMEYVRGIEKLLGLKLPSEILAGFEPSGKPEPEEEDDRGPRPPRGRSGHGGKGARPNNRYGNRSGGNRN